MRQIINVGFILVAVFGFSSAGFAQFGTGQPTEVKPQVDGPAPARDLTGVWTRLRPTDNFYSGSTFTPEPPKVTAWGQERLDTAKNSNAADGYALGETNDPVLTRCYPPGVPRVYFHPYPFEVVNSEKETIILYEYDHLIRRVYTDGRANPEDPVALWLGNSVGTWEDDNTFVVTTVGIDERTWLDRTGYQHSEQLRVTETFRRIDNLNLEIDIVMEDPIALAEPWVAETMYFRLAPNNWELSEISCAGDYLDYAEFENFLEE